MCPSHITCASRINKSLLAEACNLFPLRKSVNMLYGLRLVYIKSMQLSLLKQLPDKVSAA